MDGRTMIRGMPSAAFDATDSSEAIAAELDEPPDQPSNHWRPSKLHLPPQFARRESLLTQQLHFENEPSEGDEHTPQPPRALSTQSNWSSNSHSVTSPGELTSDDGRSVASPGLSPPLPPTRGRTTVPAHEKPLERHVKIFAQEDTASSSKDTGSEKSVEADLGRRRCITFACRGEEEKKQETQQAPPPTSQPAKEEPASPPKRKCAIKFACPSRPADQTSKPVEKPAIKRPVSPPPPTRRSSLGLKGEPTKAHRGSDSTVTHTSPKAPRKSIDIPMKASTSIVQTPRPALARKFSNDSCDSDSGNEATRFHEFATSEDEPEEWVQESTCHRSRLTVTDTLLKENVIRRACEEVEEEVVEDEDDDDEQDIDENGEDITGLDADEDEDESEEEDVEEESDDGFHSDDEDGFANSDSEGEGGSDYEWWRPGGASTAATSLEHLDRLAIINSDKEKQGSSLDSNSSGSVSPHGLKPKPHRMKHHRTASVPINQPQDRELPDSTDFVCGTLDEDRPLEQAYINRMKSREAAKHPTRPQDIDPSFPTSDPELEEEDNDDVDDASSDDDGTGLVHGDMDEIHGPHPTKRRPSPRGRKAHNKSPPPPLTTRHHSPPPKPGRTACRSPPPPTRRHATTARSPPPRKLFGCSPKRVRSPAPSKRMTSPPNSPTQAFTRFPLSTHGLGQRPQLTHTASLPRAGTGFTLSKLASASASENSGGSGSDTAGPSSRKRTRSRARGTPTDAPTAVPKRGAIDIFKGLEKKRQRRKEKLYQKMCAKNAAKGEKTHKVKPGKGAERMREVGLGLQEYHGRAEHILSL